MRSPPSDYLKRRWARQQRLFEQFKRPPPEPTPPPKPDPEPEKKS